MSADQSPIELIEWAERMIEGGRPIAALYIDRIELAEDILKAYRLGVQHGHAKGVRDTRTAITRAEGVEPEGRG